MSSDLPLLTLETFDTYVAAGGLVRPTDPMPEAYRQQLVRVIGFQALAEIVGASMYTEWLPRVPGLHRKLILTAKCQDELGHAQVLMRVVEDLGVDRDSLIEDYLAGRAKLLNIFHYPIESWPELPIASILQNSAAIVQFQSLVKGSYLPYVRALKKIMREESFHYYNALDLATTLRRDGPAAAQPVLQAALDKWFPLVLAYFGPNDRDQPRADSLRWRIKVDPNEDVRQRWIGRTVAVMHELGLAIGDPQLRRREDGVWEYSEPDWAAVKRVIAGHGPASALRHEQLARRFEQHRRVRLALAEAAA